MSQLNNNTTNLQNILSTVNTLPDAVSVTVDDALSETSTNPVQNKIVTEALNQKADAIHQHSTDDITSGTLSVARGGTGNTSIDTIPTSDSTKMVTSGGVYTALSAKADSSHTQVASTITAGTFAGEVIANAEAQTPAISLLRNSKLVAAETNPENEGEIIWIYQ